VKRDKRYLNVGKKVTVQEALAAGDAIGVDWGAVDFSPKDLAKGMTVELEHGTTDPETNVTNDSTILTAKIALAHLKERADYYVLLEELEARRR
jgi:hypothetical protein